MSRVLGVQLDGTLQWNWQDTGNDLTVLRDNGKNIFSSIQFQDGSGPSQSNLIWHDLRTLANGTSETLDMTSLTRSVFGSTNTVNLAHVKGLVIVNLNAVITDDLTIGNAAATQFVGPMSAGTNTIKVLAGATLQWTDPYGNGWATSGANNLKVNNASSASIQYAIVVWGN